MSYSAACLPIANALLPDEEQGPRAARVILDLAAGVEKVVSLFDVLAGERIDNIQSIFVDNRAGTNPVVITTSVLGATFSIPAGKQAMLPFFMSRGDGRISVTRADAGTLPLFFLNTPLPAFVWDADAAGDVVVISGTVTVSPVRPSAAARTSVAGAIASTVLLAANANRRGATFFNDSAATLYLGEGATPVSTADYTVQVGPYGTYEIEPDGFTGELRGIWSAATGAVKITERT